MARLRGGPKIMSLFTRFGDRVELVRLATVDDVRVFEHRKPDKEDRERTRGGWRAIARYCGGPNRGSLNPKTNGCGDENVGREILVDAAYVKATDGWKEISEAFQELQAKTSLSKPRS
jgi:hypothetical protein